MVPKKCTFYAINMWAKCTFYQLICEQKKKKEQPRTKQTTLESEKTD